MIFGRVWGGPGTSHRRKNKTLGRGRVSRVIGRIERNRVDGERRKKDTSPRKYGVGIRTSGETGTRGARGTLKC